MFNSAAVFSPSDDVRNQGNVPSIIEVKSKSLFILWLKNIVKCDKPTVYIAKLHRPRQVCWILSSLTMSDILLDFIAILKLFTAGVICVGGILLAICYCCFLRDIDDIKLGPEYSKKTVEDYVEEVTGCEENAGEDALPQKKSFENESCYVEDETKDTDEQKKVSAWF